MADLSQLSDEQLNAYRDIVAQKQGAASFPNPKTGESQQVPKALLGQGDKGLPGVPAPNPPAALQAQPTAVQEYQKFGTDHPYISGAMSLLPGLGALAPGGEERGKGALKTIGRDAYNIATGPGLGPIGMAVGYLAKKPSKLLGGQSLNDKVNAATEPNSEGQKFGSGMVTAGEMLAPAAEGATMIPRIGRAASKFAAFEPAINSTLVDTSGIMKPALDANRLNAITGDTVPQVLKKALKFSGPTTDPLTYEKSRILSSATGRRAAQAAEAPRIISPRMNANVSELSGALGDANEAVANNAGVGPQYRDAMTEYRRAKQLQAAGASALRMGKKVAPYAAGGGVLGMIGRHMLGN